MYLDCVLHDLRQVFGGGGLEVKCSEPFCRFKETVSDSSSVKCLVNSANKKNSISMMAEPLDKGLSDYLDSGYFDLIPDLLVS